MVDKSFTSSLIGATEDVLFIGPDGNTEGPGSPDLLIYVLPGNPCLISFYESFMSHLSELLNHKKRKVVVCGSTLPGFQPAQPTTLHGTLPVGLENQILNAEELAIRAITRCTSTRGIGGAGPDTQVVLVAHSVGAYMALEILRRRAQGLNRLAEFNVMGAVLLFPTIVEIAKSQHGIILSVRLLAADGEVLLLMHAAAISSDPKVSGPCRDDCAHAHMSDTSACAIMAHIASWPWLTPHGQSDCHFPEEPDGRLPSSVYDH